MAVAPWVLWPLVDRTPRSWPWRITRSALAVACLGGVNAVASGAALVLPAIWFLTRKPAVRTYAWGCVWLGAVFSAIAWWLAPLFLLGRYSPPFLDWIEGIAVTSSTASLFEAVRGTSAWLGFLQLTSGPTWPGGFVFVSEPALILATLVVAAAGLVGLSLRAHVAERLFLAVSVSVGLLLLTAGHVGGADPFFADSIRALLDGSLAPLRNMHKFDLVVRIPLALGAMATIHAAASQAARARLVPILVPLCVSMVVLSLAAPAVVGSIAKPEAYSAIPQHWRDAAKWLDNQADDGAVLVLPAFSFADFEWGSTKDNPLQALSERAFVHRDAVPLGSAGATRFLDGLEAELGTGAGGEHVREVLATAGIRYVLLPNDLRLDVAGNDLFRVHSALEKSGLRVAASFGETRGGLEGELRTMDYRTVLERPRIDVYDVSPTGATILPLTGVRRAQSTAPENLMDLARYGRTSVAWLDGDGHGQAASGSVLAMDGRTAREVDFGLITGNRSHLLSGHEAPRQDRAVHDFVIAPGQPRTVQSWDGVAAVTASSSASDAGATLRLGPGYGPAAAVDGDPETGWVSGRFGAAVGEWLQLDFERPTTIREVSVRVFGQANLGASPTTLAIETERGSVTLPVFPNGLAEGFAEPGVTRWLRVSLESTTDDPENGFGVAEIVLPDREVLPRTQVPGSPGGAFHILRRDQAGVPQCASVEGKMRCNPTIDSMAEEHTALRRSISVHGEPQAVIPYGRVSARDSPAIDALLNHPAGVLATASSRLVAGIATRPGGAVDGDIRSGWVAGDGDLEPVLTLELPEPRTVAGMEFVVDDALAASRPREVRVEFDDDTTITRRVSADGRIRFAPREVREARLTFIASDATVSIDSTTARRSILPVGVSEVVLTGAEDLNVSLAGSQATGVPCGFGPTLTINGRELTTRVYGTLDELRRDGSLRWEMCGNEPIRLTAGENLIDVVRSGEFIPDSVVLAPSGSPLRWQQLDRAPISRPTSTSLTVATAPDIHDRLIAVPQNYSTGWEARDEAGKVLEEVRVNGWMQGWVLPAGSGELEATFTPQRVYTGSLSVGVFLLVGLVLLSFDWRHSARGRSWLGPPAPSGRPGYLVPFALLTALAVIAGGWLLLLAAAAVVALAGTLLHRSPSARRLLLVLVPGGILTAGLIVAANPWPRGQANVSSGVVAALILSATVLSLTLATWPVADSPYRGRRRSRDGIEP